MMGAGCGQPQALPEIRADGGRDLTHKPRDGTEELQAGKGRAHLCGHSKGRRTSPCCRCCA